jgi:hypothetical protein
MYIDEYYARLRAQSVEDGQMEETGSGGRGRGGRWRWRKTMMIPAELALLF